jgi:hypothetical protein
VTDNLLIGLIIAGGVHIAALGTVVIHAGGLLHVSEVLRKWG